LPDLKQEVNNVQGLSLRSGDESVEFKRRADGSWSIPARSDFPADRPNLDTMPLALTHSELIETKTKNPELHGQLVLDTASPEEGPNEGDADEAAAAATLPTFVEVFGPANRSLGSLWVGNRRARGTQEAYFVKREGDPQTWLATGNLRMDAKVVGWMDAELMNIPGTEIQGVHIAHPGGEEIWMAKGDEAGSNSLAIVNLPAGKEPQSEWVTSRFASALTSLRLEDVRAASEVSMPEDELTTAEFWTQDGLHVIVKTLEQDGSTYAKFTADYAPDGAPSAQAGPLVDKNLPNVLDPSGEAAPEEPETDPAVVQAKADALNAKTKDWVYILPTYKASNLRAHMQELLKSEDEESAFDDPDPPVIPEGVPNLEDFELPKELEGLLQGAQPGGAPAGDAGSNPAANPAANPAGNPAVDPAAEPAKNTGNPTGAGSEKTPKAEPGAKPNDQPAGPDGKTQDKPAEKSKPKKDPVFEVDPDAVKDKTKGSGDQGKPQDKPKEAPPKDPGM